MRKGVLTGAAVAAARVAAAPPYADNHEIAATDGVEFTPDEVPIAVGDTVTWTFDNPNNPHNVVAGLDSTKAWSTGPEGATITTNHADVGPITFAEAGTYTFHCEVHGA